MKGKKQESIYIRDTKIKVTDILGLMGQGYLYNSILYKYPNLTILDIMNTAKLAKELIEKLYVEDEKIRIDSEIRIVARRERVVNLSKIQEKYSRAYEKWHDKEDQVLLELFKMGKSYNDLTEILQRQKGAIVSRLRKLGKIK